MSQTPSRNIFVNFLGTNPYIACNYHLDDGRGISNVRFVQEAMVQLLCEQFTDNDRILICLTEEAAAKNWHDTAEGATHIPGLQSRLTATGKAELIETVAIPAGKTPDEMWSIFACILAKLDHGDRITLDITHGFRSLPMLGLVLLHYARMLKQITIDGIYYGAFETLGTIREVKNMEVSQRNAPIFNLTDFSVLLDWSGAVRDFTHRGDPADIAELLNQAARPRNRISKGKDELAGVWSAASYHLKAVAQIIKTCRGNELVKAEAFTKMHENLIRCEQLPELPHPFRPLLKQIDSKIEAFQPDDIDNFLRAVKWCNQHGLTQQSITLFQEGVVSLLCSRFCLDWRNKNARKMIEGSLHVNNQNIPQTDWRSPLSDPAHKKLITQILEDPIISDISSRFDKLSKLRNDINHAGIVQSRCAARLEKEYKKNHREIILILNRHRNVAIKGG
jgi:CRISPR-associated Csx2 family protein